MNIIVNFIVLSLIVVLAIVFAACFGVLCYSFAYTVFCAIFTAEDIITRSDKYGHPDRRGVRIARWTIPFLKMTAGQQWGDEYPINQIQYDEWTR